MATTTHDTSRTAHLLALMKKGDDAVTTVPADLSLAGEVSRVAAHAAATEVGVLVNNARRAGGIITVASSIAFQPSPHQAVYGATKAFALASNVRGVRAPVGWLQREALQVDAVDGVTSVPSSPSRRFRSWMRVLSSRLRC